MGLPLQMELRSYGYGMEEQEGQEDMHRKQELNSSHHEIICVLEGIERGVYHIKQLGHINFFPFMIPTELAIKLNRWSPSP